MELDAILAKVGDERFFQYILDTLKELYPKRDYNRAIDIETEELGVKHEESLEIIEEQIQNIVNDESDKIKDELRDVTGFIDVNEKLKEIKERLAKVLTDDPDYEDFSNKLAELVKSHPFFSNNKVKGSHDNHQNDGRKAKGKSKPRDSSR